MDVRESPQELWVIIRSLRQGDGVGQVVCAYENEEEADRHRLMLHDVLVNYWSGPLGENRELYVTGRQLDPLFDVNNAYSVQKTSLVVHVDQFMEFLGK